MSVAICTRDRPAQLRRAVSSVFDQSQAPAEVLVIDNAPRDHRAQMLIHREFDQARYLREPVPGLDVARNRALSEARGDLVAFLDDDAVADSQWARTLQRVFEEDDSVGACTGRVEPLSLETEAQRLFERNGGFARGDRRVKLPQDAARFWRGLPAPLIACAISVGSGCSLALRRDLALALGGFDEALDRGPALPGGGDHDMLWRMLRSGADVVYEPAALARHEHRRDLSAAHEQIIGHQRALIALLTKHVLATRGRDRIPVLFFLVWRLLKPGVRLARRAVGLDPLSPTLLLRVWANCWRGLGSYPVASRSKGLYLRPCR